MNREKGFVGHTKKERNQFRVFKKIVTIKLKRKKNHHRECFNEVSIYIKPAYNMILLLCEDVDDDT